MHEMNLYQILSNDFFYCFIINNWVKEIIIKDRNERIKKKRSFPEFWILEKMS